MQNARIVTQQIGTVAVTLKKEGGDRVLNSTKAMKLGQDRMAVVLDGQALIAPTVKAKLGRDFVINGLDGKEETRRITKALNNRARFIHPVTAGDADVKQPFGHVGGNFLRPKNPHRFDPGIIDCRLIVDRR